MTQIMPLNKGIRPMPQSYLSGGVPRVRVNKKTPWDFKLSGQLSSPSHRNITTDGRRQGEVEIGMRMGQ